MFILYSSGRTGSVPVPCKVVSLLTSVTVAHKSGGLRRLRGSPGCPLQCQLIASTLPRFSTRASASPWLQPTTSIFNCWTQDCQHSSSSLKMKCPFWVTTLSCSPRGEKNWPLTYRPTAPPRCLSSKATAPKSHSQSPHAISTRQTATLHTTRTRDTRPR